MLIFAKLKLEANKKARIMAVETINTGKAVEIIPVPIPLMITVAGPVFEAEAIAWVGL